jgi:serine protease Do
MSGTTLRAALLVAGLAAIALPAPQAFSAGRAALLPSFSALVEATQPAVVTVRTTVDAGNARLGPAPRDEDGRLREFLDRFFGREGRTGTPEEPSSEPPAGALPREVPVGLGSGFIVDPGGVVVTNHHVVEGADELTVILDDGAELPAELVASDDKTDIAVLRIDAGRPLPTVAWGDSSAVKVGDWAVAIGNPFGLGASVSVGIISASGRSIQSGPYDDYFQIDAPINRGNSGGPLFDQGAASSA